MNIKPAAKAASQPRAEAETTKSKSRAQNTKRHPEVLSAQVKDILSVLLVFRFINALCVRTFFQPDEYFQALEPAWSIAFGADSGAWLTWEWQHQLRSSLHPLIFGAVYKAAYSLMTWLQFFAPFKAGILVALPGLVQSVFAALGDFYTWRLASEIYGIDSNVPWTALWMTVLNPWQWYCSTRTFSNSLETTLTIAALYYWPWELLKDAKVDKGEPLRSSSSLNSLRASLFLAAIAVLLRPTNLLIWLGVLIFTVLRFTLDGASAIQPAVLFKLGREIVICGLAALGISVVSDRLYFGFWAFPPYKWLYFNISQSLAVFYGKMPWHYYLVQGIPLLTTTFLPFALIGLYKTSLSFSHYSPSKTGLTTLQSNILRTLSSTLLLMIATLSVISHKEVRFIYPLLPILHILAASYTLNFFAVPSAASTPPGAGGSVTLRHKLFLANLLSINLLLAGYLSLFHQPAPLSVLNFLRSDFERLHPDSLSLSLDEQPNTNTGGQKQQQQQQQELFALFLTPCHSTPWRSHLVYPALHARALTCEPPLDTAPGSVERETYLDEADRFYQKDSEGRYGVDFLRGEMWPLIVGEDGQRGGEVPRYIVGFEGVEGLLRRFFEEGEGSGMGVRLERVWEGWNGVFNEDWRRGGRLVVWGTGRG
ncbi:glycosyltransferase family 22 protein [Cercophora newfieldiana]|uniref:Mannosyltransferase n=1 Tax=Cercophora newfieldiana TaxID=92897 RepID=A0AA39Y663_9PEZI|nr:glycosyltransferase family 22 protein [Cercophora newfieldiana]